MSPSSKLSLENGEKNQVFIVILVHIFCVKRPLSDSQKTTKCMYVTSLALSIDGPCFKLSFPCMFLRLYRLHEKLNCDDSVSEENGVSIIILCAAVSGNKRRLVSWKLAPRLAGTCHNMACKE